MLGGRTRPCLRILRWRDAASAGREIAGAQVEGVLRDLVGEHHPPRVPSRTWLRRSGRWASLAAVPRTGASAHWARRLRMIGSSISLPPEKRPENPGV